MILCIHLIITEKLPLLVDHYDKWVSQKMALKVCNHILKQGRCGFQCLKVHEGNGETTESWQRTRVRSAESSSWPYLFWAISLLLLVSTLGKAIHWKAQGSGEAATSTLLAEVSKCWAQLLTGRGAPKISVEWMNPWKKKGRKTAVTRIFFEKYPVVYYIDSDSGKLTWVNKNRASC